MAALDLPSGERDDVRLLAACNRRRDVTQTLVAPFPMEMGQILVEVVPQVVLAEADEVIQALSLYRLDCSFARRIPLRDEMRPVQTTATERFG